MDRSTKTSPIDWSRIDQVLLDMDGTVLDLAFDNHFWRELLPARYAEHHGLELAEAHARLNPHFAGLQGRLEWYCLDHWSRLTGLDVAALKAQARERIAPLPGSESFLRAVRASGRPLWLVTNAHRDSWQLKLRPTGLADRFDHIVCAHDFGAPKEDARFWPALAARHPFEPARALFVDDSLPVLRAARTYGFAAVVAVLNPDTTLPRKAGVEGFVGIEGLEGLLPIE